MSMKKVFVEAQNTPAPIIVKNKIRELIENRVKRAFIEIGRAIQAGERDKAASAANFAGQEIDQMFRDAAQKILGGSNE